MLDSRDLKPLPTAIATAAAAGLALGLWVSPPAALLTPAQIVHPAGLIDARDPNLTSYREMLAQQGIDPSPVVPPPGVRRTADQTDTGSSDDTVDATPAGPGDNSADSDDDDSLPRSIPARWSASDEANAAAPEQFARPSVVADPRSAEDAGQAPPLQALAQRIWSAQ